MVHNVRSEEQFQEALQNYKNVVIDFYDVHSAESKHVAATFAHCYELDKFKDYRFLKIDINEMNELSQHLGVTQPATFQMYRDGEKIREIQTDKVEELVEFLESGV